MKRNKTIVFISGLITGFLLIGATLGNGILFYKLGGRLIDILSSKAESKENIQSAIPERLNLSFENPEDSLIFRIRDAAAEVSDTYASEGKRSFLVEFPGGRPNPGIFFDIIGRRCLNWSNMKSFSFDVFNSGNARGSLYVQLKSGEKYPKRVFKKEFELQPLSWTKVAINHGELENKLDLDKISHLTLTIIEPYTTFKLYFDNMKVTDDSEK